MQANDILAAARIRVSRRHPYLSTVLFSLRLVPLKGLGTMGVDAGWRLWYDPQTVEEWGPGGKVIDTNAHDGCAAALAHECWHVLYETMRRQSGRDKWRWNCAEDRAINDGLVTCGWRFPITPLLPQQIKMKNGLTGEEYYDKEPEPTAIKILMPGCGGSCGGIAGNPQGDHEHTGMEGAARSGGKDSPLPPPMGEAEKQIVLRCTAQEIQKAASRGNVPRDLVEWAEKQLKPPTIPWQKQLAALVRRGIAAKAGCVDFTYSRPSRRQWGMRMALGAGTPILPAMYAPVPDVGVCLDCSGSMCGAPALAARSEVLGIAKAVGASVWTYVADTRIAGKRRVKNKVDVSKLGDTCGGTDMAEAIRSIEKIRRHDVVVLITDGITPFPERGEYRCRLLAAITPNGELPPSHIPYVQIKESK